MKKQLLLTLGTLFLFVSGFSQSMENKKTELKNEVKQEVVKTTAKLEKVSSVQTKPDRKTKKLRKKHEGFLANTPLNKTMVMSKDVRKAHGLPPNKYLEQEWDRSINPETGKVDLENLRTVRDRLINERATAISQGRVPGDAVDNAWTERGPNNVGGRTRGIMFDPSDPTSNTVFAGGVSGGLWKNTNISSSASTWTRINIPQNLNISTLTYDPNNITTFYAGTGESYVFGDVSGDGLWKSTDRGVTWTKVLGGITGPTFFQSASKLTINSPGGIAGDYPYLPTTAFGSSVTVPITQNIVLVIDGTSPTSDGCEAITNTAALNGKIALVRRGTCSFAAKALAAQNAGAVAVIIMNNIDNAGAMGMGGSDPLVTIPAISISKEDGDILETALSTGTVNGTINPTTPGLPSGNIVPGIQFVNDVVVKDNGGTSEIYVAVGDTWYSSSATSTYQGSDAIGLYKSTDGGASWSQLSLPLTTAGNPSCPNDIEIDFNGTIWVSTTDSWNFGDGGGKIYASTNGGASFTLKHSVVGYTSGSNGTGGVGARVEIETSNTTSNVLYVLSELSGVTAGTNSYETIMLKTNDGFTTAPTTLVMPAGNETRETTYGFTGGQAFYDMMIESDPTNHDILYVGGIDLYRSTTGGSAWTTISNWTTNVHSDQHAMAFKPGIPNTGIFGNDGGVYFTSNLSSANSATARNNGFNVTQFHSVSVAPKNAVSGLTNDYYMAGAQDNGSNYFAGVAAGIQPSFEIQGGDGGPTVADEGADKYFVTSYVYNYNINYRTTSGATRRIDNDASSASNGAFYPAMALDSGNDILYTDYSDATYIIRRYSNLKGPGGVSRASITNALLTNRPTALKVSPYGKTLYAGTRNGKLIKITNPDGISTWTDITGPGFLGSVSDVEFGASENDIFVTFHNYGVVNIWYTANGLSATPTWVNKEGDFPDIPVKCILQNPLNNNEVIIGTDLGVWYTNTFNTASPIWRQSYNGMTNVKVSDLDLQVDSGYPTSYPAASYTVYAATYGRGVFSGAFTNAVLSSDSFANNKGVKVYPNPSNGVVNLNITDFSGNLNIQLFDINGREVYKSNVSDFSIEKSIDVSQFQSGIYILKLEGEELSYSEKIILK
jgi:hypothetical protein